VPEPARRWNHGPRLSPRPLAAGCGTSSIKEELLPKASVPGVTVVELNPRQLTLKVNVKTVDVDLMLGMVKMK
jgi:hypothetical protein